MSKYRIGSLFSGYGGLDLGVQAVFGGKIAWVSDIDKGPCKILAYHHPNVPNLGDITSVDWAQVEPVDIICGGSPCQDLSLAGCRAGMMAGTRSGLWESMLTAIQTIRPAYVVWENVKGAHSARAYSKMESRPRCVGAPDPTGGSMPLLRGTGRVLGDLANAGYDAKWVTIRASDVGAPHRRERVFVYAWRRDVAENPNRSGMRGRASESSPRQTPEPDITVDGADNRPCATRQTSGLALLPTPSTIDAKPVDVPHQMETRDNPGLHCAAALFSMPRELWPTTPGMDETRLLPTPAARDYKDSHIGPLKHRSNDYDLLPRAVALMPTCHKGREEAKSYNYLCAHETRRNLTSRDQWGKFAQAIHRWENVLDRAAPSPVEPTGRNGTLQLSARFVEWMMGLPDGWVTSVPGISRTEAIKACGNGVVPQQAAYALQKMTETEATK